MIIAGLLNLGNIVSCIPTVIQIADIMNFSGFSFLEVLVAAASAFVIGGIWYSPALFGKTWQKLVGLSDEKMQEANMLVIFGTSYILLFFAALFLSFFVEISMMMGSNALAGAMAGGFVCLIFVATTFGVNYLFARRPLRLYFIDAGYMLVAFVVMGFIIGAWK